jgi:hypothetical protein
MYPRLPYIVIDQNKLRDATAITAVFDRCNRENLQALLPDGAGFEFSNVLQPFETWLRSLKCLCDRPELVSVSVKMTALLKRELTSGIGCGDVMDPIATAFLRSLLYDLRKNDLSRLRKLIDGPVRTLLPASSAAWSDSAKHKNWIRIARESLRAEMSPAMLSALRKRPHEELGQWMSSEHGIRFVFQGVKAQGFTDDAAVLLCSRPSISAAFISAMGILGLYWLAVGGLEDASPGKFTNDLHDVEYVILGSLSRDLVTSDKRLAAVADAVSRGSESRYAWFSKKLE